MNNKEPQFSWTGFLTISITIGLVAAASLYFVEAMFKWPPDESKNLMTSAMLMFFITGISFGVLAYFPVLALRRFIWQMMQKDSKVGQLSSSADQLQETMEHNFFTALIRINFKFLDAYYLQTQLQADKSFLLCVGAAVISLALIVIGIIMMFFNQLSNPAMVTIAAGALGEMMAGIFFYLYNQTIRSMGDYHHKLVLTQNIGIALKISESMPDTDRVVAQQKLIENLSQNINQCLGNKEENKG